MPQNCTAPETSLVRGWKKGKTEKPPHHHWNSWSLKSKKFPESKHTSWDGIWWFAAKQLTNSGHSLSSSRGSSAGPSTGGASTSTSASTAAWEPSQQHAVAMQQDKSWKFSMQMQIVKRYTKVYTIYSMISIESESKSKPSFESFLMWILNGVPGVTRYLVSFPVGFLDLGFILLQRLLASHAPLWPGTWHSPTAPQRQMRDILRAPPAAPWRCSFLLFLLQLA